LEEESEKGQDEEDFQPRGASATLRRASRAVAT
jgi:hypothetical protein